MNNEKEGRKILDLGFDGEHLNIDVRISIPSDKFPSQFVKDLLANKSAIIDGIFDDSGRYWVDTKLVFDDNEEIYFIKTSKEIAK